MKLRDIKPEGASTDELLQEIFMQPKKEYPELSKASLGQHTAEIEGATHARIIPLENGRYSLKIISESATLFEGDKLIGFIDFTGHDISGKVYMSIKLIYTIPEARTGKELLLMINACRSFFKKPILITGAVFKGGVRAIKILKHRKDFRTMIIDLDTGETSPYNDELINDESKGIVIEGFGWPPYMNYRKGDIDHEICPVLFEMLGENIPDQSEITAIVKTEVERFGFPDMKVEGRADGNWLLVIIGNQSASFKIDNEGTLHLADVYVPEELRNSGFMTAVLKRIRKLDGLNGDCQVHVAMNPAWEKIITRSGFNLIKTTS
jgi:hypothetical protein